MTTQRDRLVKIGARIVRKRPTSGDPIDATPSDCGAVEGEGVIGHDSVSRE
jgi:hypothetical protein